MGTYVDATAPVAVNAIRLMVGIDTALSIHSDKVKENRTIKMIAETAMFYDEYARNVLAKKEGTFRKHVYGTRSHFSFRAVISSLTEWHRYDEVHIPWGIGIAALELHLKKLLMREGMTPWQADQFIAEHTQKYHPKLDAMFQELIARAPSGKGICITLQRNPSLGRASCQTVYVTKVKTDVEIPTISMSILIVKGFNA
jgi:DNA-directed RNA polymerase beta' subunit